MGLAATLTCCVVAAAEPALKCETMDELNDEALPVLDGNGGGAALCTRRRPRLRDDPRPPVDQVVAVMAELADPDRLAASRLYSSGLGPPPTSPDDRRSSNQMNADGN